MENTNPPHAFPHIPGWGSDLGRRNGTHGAPPMQTGAGNMPEGEPSQQPQHVEILISTEHAGITPVFGATLPPSGLSGIVRRAAFKLSENDIRHWMLLLLADRVNVGEGLLSDVVHGHVPNLVAEMGGRAEWQHNKRGALKKAAIAGFLVGVVLVVSSRRRR